MLRELDEGRQIFNEKIRKPKSANFRLILVNSVYAVERCFDGALYTVHYRISPFLVTAHRLTDNPPFSKDQLPRNMTQYEHRLI